MRKEDKQVIIDSILSELQACPNFYLTDVSDLNAEKTSQLRRQCFNSGIKMLVVKNSLLHKAMMSAMRSFFDLMLHRASIISSPM